MSERGCSTCIHDGCCENLPYCGGAHWSPAYGKCSRCGAEIALDDCEEDADGNPLCHECADAEDDL